MFTGSGLLAARTKRSATREEESFLRAEARRGTKKSDEEYERDDIPRKVRSMGKRQGEKREAGIRVASYCRASTDLWDRYQFFSPRRSRSDAIMPR